MDSDPNSFAANSFAAVIDTNIVLDLFVFNDEAAQPIRQALDSGHMRWLATPAMRVELERVLAYPKIAPRVAFYKLQAGDVLSAFDKYTGMVDPAPKASVSCKDPDDQIYIDLAVAHKARLFSKDRAVLAMKKRLATLHVAAGRTLAETTA